MTQATTPKHPVLAELQARLMALPVDEAAATAAKVDQRNHPLRRECVLRAQEETCLHAAAARLLQSGEGWWLVESTASGQGLRMELWAPLT